MVGAGKVVVIAGDSWGCGEWTQRDHRDYYVSHAGLAQYLADDGYQVINLSQPGAGNGMISDRLRLLFELSPGLTVHRVIVFQSDFMRDNAIRFPGGPGTFLTEGIIDASASVNDFEGRAVSGFYYELSRLATKYNISISIIGGHCDTEWLDRFSAEYPGVNVICQSMTEFLLTGNHRTSEPVFSHYDIGAVDMLPELKKKFGIDFLYRLGMPKPRLDRMQDCREFFYPDNLHANRQGHKKLYEEIVRFIL